jgi:hypothetical protein
LRPGARQGALILPTEDRCRRACRVRFASEKHAIYGDNIQLFSVTVSAYMTARRQKRGLNR